MGGVWYLLSLGSVFLFAHEVIEALEQVASPIPGAHYFITAIELISGLWALLLLKLFLGRVGSKLKALALSSLIWWWIYSLIHLKWFSLGILPISSGLFLLLLHYICMLLSLLVGLIFLNESVDRHNS